MEAKSVAAQEVETRGDSEKRSEHAVTTESAPLRECGRVRVKHPYPDHPTREKSPPHHRLPPQTVRIEEFWCGFSFDRSRMASERKFFHGNVRECYAIAAIESLDDARFRTYMISSHCRLLDRYTPPLMLPPSRSINPRTCCCCAASQPSSHPIRALTVLTVLTAVGGCSRA